MSPRATSKETSSSAMIPPKRTDSPRIRRSGAAACSGGSRLMSTATAIVQSLNGKGDLMGGVPGAGAGGGRVGVRRPFVSQGEVAPVVVEVVLHAPAEPELVEHLGRLGGVEPPLELAEHRQLGVPV